MALAVRAKDAQLLVEINRALAQLAESGELQTIYGEHGVPFRPPFTATSPQQKTAPDTWRRIRERGELVVSMDPANLPYSSARDDRPGFDVELARALADRLHLKLRLEWLDIHRETAVGELIEGRCDLVFGEAVDANAVADDEPLAGKILYSRPYYRTGYVLVRRKDGPRAGSLAELKGAKSQRLGTEAGSVADYQLRQRGYFRRLYRNQLAVLKALGDGDIDFAYLWANAGWTLHVSPDLDAKLELVPGFEPEDRWNIAVAMRRGDDELKRQVDAALGTLIADGTVARVLARYHVPHEPPSPAPPRDPRADAEGTIHHEMADRGREPEMRKIQTSKHPYDALARIRSAGELVVGLDQGNLPFSTAHPAPAGLDYEIAGLLAEQLGVSLRVYWAVFRARLVSLEAGGQAALRRDPGGHARRSVCAAGPLFAAVLCRAIPVGRPIGRRTARGAGAAGRRGGGRGARTRGAAGASLSQHRSGPGGGGDGSGAGGLRDRDPRALAGTRALAG